MSVGVLGSLLVAAANGHYLEANLAKRVTVEEHAPIKHERGLVHRLVHGAPVDVTELCPFRCNDDGLTVLRSLERSLGDGDLFLDWGKKVRQIEWVVAKEQGMRTLVEGNVWEGLGEVEPDLRLFDLRVKDGDASALGKEIANEGDGRRFAGVSGVGFEGKAENGDVLTKGDERGAIKGKGPTLLVMVLKSESTTRFENRRFWYSFIVTTWRQ
jgi:hypothetical protein